MYRLEVINDFVVLVASIHSLTLLGSLDSIERSDKIGLSLYFIVLGNLGTNLIFIFKYLIVAPTVAIITEERMVVTASTTPILASLPVLLNMYNWKTEKLFLNPRTAPYENTWERRDNMNTLLEIKLPKLFRYSTR